MQMMSIDMAQSQILDAQAQSVKQGMRSRMSEADQKAARDTAEQFEAVFLSQMLAPMFDTVPTDGPMGGGNAESVYRTMMVEEVGKSIAKKGGIGIADQVYREILKLQEA